MRDVGDGLRISAEKGLFLAQEVEGKVTIVPSGTDTGPAQAQGIHRLPSGGMLIGTPRRAWFEARTDGSKLTLTPAGNVDAGRIAVIRDFGGRVLIGGEKGLLVAGAAGCAGR